MNRFSKISKTALVFTAAAFVFGIFSLAPAAEAQDYTPLAPIPGTVKDGGTTDLSTYLTGGYQVGIAVAGALAFLVIVWGGFKYVSTDAIGDKLEGKEYIKRAIGGLILALGSFLLLQAINPNLVNLDLFFGGPVERVVRPPVRSAFHGQLDALLERVDDISTRAQELQRAQYELWADIEAGEYKTQEELQEAINRIGELEQAERVVRDFENTDARIDIARSNIAACAAGNGTCRKTTILEALTSGVREELGLGPNSSDKEVMDAYLQGLENTVPDKIQELERVGMNERAKLLREKLVRTRIMNLFWQSCPDSAVYTDDWQPNGECPP